MFIAPLNGTYVITVTLSADLVAANGTVFHALIMTNGRNVARLVGHNRQQSTQTIILEMEQGQTVFVLNTMSEIYTVLGSLYSTMSGFLLPQVVSDSSSL